jgi:hypothetical protein
MTDDPKAQWAHSKALEIRLSFRGKTERSQFFHTFPPTGEGKIFGGFSECQIEACKNPMRNLKSKI